MSDSTTFRTPLGVGNLVGASFKLFIGNFPVLFLIGFAYSVVTGLLNNVFYKTIFEAASASPNDPSAVFTPTYFAVLAAMVLLGLLAMASVVMASGDVVRGAPIDLAATLTKPLASIVPLFVLSIVTYLGMAVGMILLIVPGMIIAAMWSVFVPCILFEGAGFGALGRSGRLTKNYRWPIIGGWILILLAVAAVSVPLSMLTGVGITSTPDANMLADGLPIWIILVQSLSGGLMYGLIGIFTVLLFTRLREIKEGSGSGVAEVFS